MSETATNNSVQGEEIQKVNLVKISARINQKIDDVMREMAKGIWRIFFRSGTTCH